MKLNKHERDSLYFCASTIAEMAQDKGITLKENDVYASLEEIMGGKNQVTASTLAPPKYNKAGDIVIAAIHHMVEGDLDAGLKMFATVLAADDAMDLAGAILGCNEEAISAMDNSETKANVAPAYGDNPGDTPDDTIDETNEEIFSVPTDGSSTLNPDSPLHDDAGEDDLTYDNATADDDGAEGPTDELTDRPLTYYSENVDADIDNILASIAASTDENDNDIIPGSADPLTDANKQRENTEDNDSDFDKPVHLIKNKDDSNDQLHEVAASGIFEKFKGKRRSEIIAAANKLSNSGKESDRNLAALFLKKALNVVG